MKLVSVVLALAACSSSGSPPGAGSGSGSSAAPVVAPPPPAPDGLPSAYVLPDGAKLVEHADGDWFYTVPRPPSAVATELVAKLGKAGWTTAARHLDAPATGSGQPAAPRPLVLALRGGTTVNTVAMADPIGSRLQISLWVGDPLLTSPPAGYPAGFPFLPFGSDESRNQGEFRLVYLSSADDLRAELERGAASAGWTCSGMTMRQTCRKAGMDVDVSMMGLDAVRLVLSVTAAKSR